MASNRANLIWVLVACCCFVLPRQSSSFHFNWSSHGFHMPSHPLTFNSVTSTSHPPCQLAAPSADSPSLNDDDGSVIPSNTSPPLKLHLKHRDSAAGAHKSKKDSLLASTHRDLTRIQTLYRRITERKNSNSPARSPANSPAIPPELEGRMVATLESGVSLGSGEYFMDVFIGTPPRHLSLILDTGSDLNWVQCLPCHDCFPQRGPHFDPAASSSFRHVTCGDPRCSLVSSPEPHRPCSGSGEDAPCPYFYWYGDRSNTTGDLAVESFTVNLTSISGEEESRRVEEVIFGCGHWNRGLFHGAAGLLGLGRGPLSFSSQLRSLYGHTFSYCLVDRNSDLTVSSKLIFGEDRNLISHPNLNYTSFVAGKDNPIDTFYYVRIKVIMVGRESLDIPIDTWELSTEGGGGTIIDSGTTLSYFADPAYRVIKEAFLKKVKNYPLVEDFPVLSPCYNVSGVENVELPEFAILFSDGAVWTFPTENYFIRLEPEGIMCLAVLGTPRSSLSILGNYQQQNFHIMYDTKKSRLGFAPMRCAEV